MHRWGDQEVDWEGIGDAAEFIGDELRRAGIFVSCTKEKYGTVRVYCSLATDEDTATYRKAYVDALAKWPHLRDEILTDADYDEYLEGI